MLPLIVLGIACVVLGGANELTKEKKPGKAKPATKGNTTTDETGNPQRGSGGSIDHGNSALADQSQGVTGAGNGSPPKVKETVDNEHSE